MKTLHAVMLSDSCCDRERDKKYSLYAVHFSNVLCVYITFLQTTGRSLDLRLRKVVLLDTVLLPVKDGYHSLTLTEGTKPLFDALVIFLKKWM
jgi:hypothetical protein